MNRSSSPWVSPSTVRRFLWVSVGDLGVEGTCLRAAYAKPTYDAAKKALDTLKPELKLTNQVEVHFPAGTMADNIEVFALGTIVFYEIEIHARDDRPTAIQRLQWRQIKCGPKGLERPACSKSSSPQSLP